MTRVLLAAIAILVLLLGVQSVRVARLKPQLQEAQRVNKAWEGYRETAEADAQAAADQCSARVSEALRSARRINDLLERPVHVDPQGCAVRELLPSDELRSALRPTPGPAAEPLHDR